MSALLKHIIILVLALPIHSALTDEDVDYVSARIRAFYA